MAKASLSRCRSCATVAPSAPSSSASDDGDTEHQERLPGEPEPLQRLPAAGAALERGAEQVGTQPALYVGSGADPEQVQRDQLGGVAERLGPLLAERSGYRGPDRAEHLVAGADGDRDARHRERVGALARPAR